MLFYYSIFFRSIFYPISCFSAHVCFPAPAFSSCSNQTILVLTCLPPCKLSCPAHSRSSVTPNPRAISPAWQPAACLYITLLATSHQQTYSTPLVRTTAACGLLVSCGSLFLQSMYIFCISHLYIHVISHAFYLCTLLQQLLLHHYYCATAWSRVATTATPLLLRGLV